MECQSRATINLSSHFKEYKIVCEQGSGLLEKGSSSQDLLLFVSSPTFEDGASVILVGKDDDDDALMLELYTDSGKEGVRWTAFILEEAIPFVVEFASSTSHSPFFLCTNHNGVFKYICLSSQNTLTISATNPNILSFEVTQLFEMAYVEKIKKSTSEEEIPEEELHPRENVQETDVLPGVQVNDTESATQIYSQTKCNSSLIIKVPDDPPKPLISCAFAEGALGMTLKRRNNGVIYVGNVEENTQAADHNICVGDILWSIGDKVVGNVAINKEGWGELVTFIKQAPRPLGMVFHKISTANKDINESSEEIAKDKNECSSVRSNFSLVDFPSNDTPHSQVPDTPPSLISAPSSSGSLCESEYSQCTTAQSVETSGTGVTETSSVVHVKSQQHEDLSVKQEAQDLVLSTAGEKLSVEHVIMEEISNRLIFKNVAADNSAASSKAKSWRSSILGGSGSSKNSQSERCHPSFQLVVKGRHLVFEGELLLLGRKALWHVKIPKVLFLFNDILLVATPSATSTGTGNKCVVDNIIDLMTCKINCRVSSSHELVSGQIDVEKKPLLWELLYPSSSGSGSMIFLCSSIKEQKQWVDNMTNSICENVVTKNGTSDLGFGWRHQYLLGTMHAAVLQRSEEHVVKLLECYADGEVDDEALEGTDSDGYTPLHYACILRLSKIVQLLQESSADVTVQDHRGLTPLHWAALQLDAQSLERLCMNIMDVDLSDGQGRSPLYLACVEGRTNNGGRDQSALMSCVTTLLTYGADPNRKDKYGLTILHHLSAEWQYSVVELLLQGFDNPLNSGKRTTFADVNMHEDKNGWTALHFACGTESLLQRNGEGQIILQSAKVATEGVDSSTGGGAGLRTLLALLEQGAMPNMTNFQGHTPLSILALSTRPRGTSRSSDDDDDDVSHASSSRWATSFDSAIMMLLSNGARISVINLRTNALSTEIPDYWMNPSVQSAIEEGLSKWSKKGELDGDVAGIRLKCFERRKCVNAEVTSDQRELAARKSNFASGVFAGGATPCLLCLTSFTMFRRQHHCRLCDALCCDECSRKRILIDKVAVRVCDTCYSMAKSKVDTILTEQFFAGHGKIHEDMTQKAELFQGAKTESSSDPNRTSNSISGTMATMEDAKLQLQERGQKLENLGDKSEKLANASTEFAKMAKQLSQQSKSNSWW